MSLSPWSDFNIKQIKEMLSLLLTAAKGSLLILDSNNIEGIVGQYDVNKAIYLSLVEISKGSRGKFTCI